MTTEPYALVLTDGDYLAVCRERTQHAATAHGYGAVFPEARMVVRDGWATFSRDGEVRWDCSARYAAAHFEIRPIESDPADAT